MGIQSPIDHGLQADPYESDNTFNWIPFQGYTIYKAVRLAGMALNAVPYDQRRIETVVSKNDKAFAAVVQ